MVLDSINKLLEKYENGETTLQEEQQLKNYFSQETIAPHLEMYKPMFAYFLETQQEQFTKDVPLKQQKNSSLYKWISVAAIAVLMFSVYTTQFAGPTAQEQEEALLAYNQTMEALNLVSSKFNKGNQNAFALNILASNFNKASNSLSYVEEFSKTTNKIFKQ
jgi:hypothetical protein